MFQFFNDKVFPKFYLKLIWNWIRKFNLFKFKTKKVVWSLKYWTKQLVQIILEDSKKEKGMRKLRNEKKGN